MLPISYGDAQPLLEALGGRVAPQSWRGALPITYHVGPGPAKVHLKVKSNWDIKPIYNVIARIPGVHVSRRVDPARQSSRRLGQRRRRIRISGASALLEEARAFGELLKQGWKPKRTIVYCVWDGEEEGLLGSTEWAEEHADELQRHAAVYINSDGNGRGYLAMSGSHSLEKFINGVARDINDPEKNITAWKRSQLHAYLEAATPESRQEVRQRPDLRIDALGSGSDYTAFHRSPGHCFAESRHSAAKMAAASTIPSTTTTTGTRIFPTAISSTGARWRKPSAAPCCGWPAQSCCLRFQQSRRYR